jgi:F-type H+-transporting ATPase subunit alpha
MKQVAGSIKLELAQYREMKAFAQFASDLDPATRAQLDRGQRVTELMKQKQYMPLSIAQMAISLYAVDKDYMDDVPLGKILAFEHALHQFMAANHGELMQKIVATGDWNADIEGQFKTALEEFKKTGSW